MHLANGASSKLEFISLFVLLRLASMHIALSFFRCLSSFAQSLNNTRLSVLQMPV